MFGEKTHLKKNDALLRSSSQKPNAQKCNSSKNKTKLMLNSAFDQASPVTARCAQ